MPNKDFDLTGMMKESAGELRGVVEKALREQPMLVLGLALELGLLAGHWARGGKVSLSDVAKRALAMTPQSVLSTFRSEKSKPARSTSRRKSAPAARKVKARRKPGRKSRAAS